MALQVMTFVLFLRTINPEYIRTFYSSRSGNAQAMTAFYENDEDKHKLEIFNRNRHKWKKIKEEVLTWVNSKIPEWNESQPEWWDARRKAAIYDWAISDPEALRSIRSEDAVKVVKERRGSILNVAGTDDFENQTPSNPDALRRRTIKAKARQLEKELNT